MDIVARDLRTLPPAMTKAMDKLRRLDTAVRDLHDSMKIQEEEFFNELAKAEKDRKESNVTVDEEYFNNKMQAILDQRNRILTMQDDKVLFAKQVYELLDSKIQYIDHHTASVRHLMQDEGDGNDGSSSKFMKKKKRKKQDNEFVAVNSLMMKADPNEPVYCYCQQVSYGEMVGCDNPECPIEWFHFECVGLTASPGQTWYCPDCRPQFQS